MDKPANDEEMKALFDRFMGSFVENRDPRMDLETNALKQLRGSYLEKAKTAILERLEKSPSLDAIWSAGAINLTDAVPIMKRWLDEIRHGPASKYRSYYFRGQLAYALYEFLEDDSYLPDVIQTVNEEGYGEFTSGVGMLSRMPLTKESLMAVWNKYKNGKTIKAPHSWRENCAWFLREKIKEPIGQSFLNELPKDEQNELLELIGESGHQRLERKFRLEKYIYGRERYNKDDVNRYDEYIKVGSSPVKGMTLTQLWKGHAGSVKGLQWSPDGHYLASYAEDDALRIWSLDSEDKVKVLQQKKEYHYSRNEPRSIAWTSPNGKKIAVYYSNYQTSSKDLYNILEWNVEVEKQASPFYGTPDRPPISELLYLPEQDTFLLCYRNAFYLFDHITKQKKQILTQYKGMFGAVALSPDGKVIAIGYYEMRDPKTGVEYQPGFYGEGVHHEILFYDILSQKVMNRLNTGHVQGINKLCWMPNSSILAVASTDNSISVWDLRQNKRIALLESQGFVGSINGLSFSANGVLLASTSHDDKILRIWRTDKWEEVMALRELNSHSSFSFHPSLPILASVCSLREANDNSSGDSPMAIRIWEFDYDGFLSNPPFMEEFNKRETEIRTKLLREEITEDLEYVKIGVSPTRGLKLHRILRGHTGRIHRISWSPDGNYLASPADDKTVRIWDEATGECVSTFEEQTEMKHCAWSPNGQHLAYGGNKQIRLWDTKTPGPVDLIQNDFLDLHSLVFSPDGKMFALAYGYNTIQILDTLTWRELSKKVIDPRSNCRINLQWSNDSRQLVASPYVGWIHILDAKTLKPIKKMAVPGDRDEIYGFSFMFTKFEDKVAIAEAKRPILVYDLLSGQIEKEYSDITSQASGLSFSPNGDVLISWCHDNSVYFWRTDTGQKLARIHEYSLRVIEPVYPSFHPVKPSLVTFCDKRRSMRIWDIDYKELFK